MTVQQQLINIAATVVVVSDDGIVPRLLSVPGLLQYTMTHLKVKWQQIRLQYTSIAMFRANCTGIITNVKSDKTPTVITVIMSKLRELKTTSRYCHLHNLGT
jgi:hypothetical protein